MLESIARARRMPESTPDGEFTTSGVYRTVSMGFWS